MRIKTVFELVLLCISSFLCLSSHAQCCDYTLTMHDSYGDGWNGATLEVKVNAISTGVFSASEYGSAVSFTVCDGDEVELFYSSGQYEEENTYELQDASWNIVFQDGPDPVTGLVATHIGDCSAPPVQGSHPCLALPIDTMDCVLSNNTGFQGTGFIPNCSWFLGQDIWYTMEVPESGNISIQTFAGSINDTGIAVWGGNSCSDLEILGCDDDGGEVYLSFLLLYDLTPGETIYIQAWKWGGGTGTFEICVNDLGTVNFESSELPIVMINTLGQTIIQETKIACMMDIKYNGPGSITFINDFANVYSGHIGIEIRGLSSAGYPQRPYGIETQDEWGENNNVSILGMPAENDWVLLSNFNDRSLLKNLLAYKLFGEMGNYSPRAQLCEVIVDSSYKGIYVFGEKLKRDSNRVDIAKLTELDLADDDLTGGYILTQNYWNSNNSFESNYSPIDHPGFDVHFVYEYPKADVILPVQKAYIASFVDSLETALYSPEFYDPNLGYRQFMDVPSFIDYFLVNEVSRNADGFKKSVFFHKDKNSNGGKLKAGPVWDFDWAWKNIDICEIYQNTDGSGWAHLNNDCFTDNYSTGWYVRLLQDESFRNELRCSYEEYRMDILNTDSLFNYIDNMGALVQNAQSRHFQKWPILGLSGPAPDLGEVPDTYLGELESLKNWIGIRLDWLDENIAGLCTSAGLIEYNTITELKIYPNPAVDELLVNFSLAASSMVSIRMHNQIGSEVMSQEYGLQNEGQHQFKIDTAELSTGLYHLKIEVGTEVLTKKISVLR
jgi:hypothetical protein